MSVVNVFKCIYYLDGVDVHVFAEDQLSAEDKLYFQCGYGTNI